MQMHPVHFQTSSTHSSHVWCLDVLGHLAVADQTGGKYGNYSKGVYESNFQQDGQSEKQGWEESERRRKEVRRSEKRMSEKKEGAGARKGRKVSIHCVYLNNDLWLWRVEK